MRKSIQILILAGLLIIGNQALACTTFLISGKYTADGKSLLFKNRDTDEMNNALVLFNDGKYKYMGLVDATEKKWKGAVWGGYNETGFGIINSAAYNNNIGDTTKFRGQDGVTMKKALMCCASVDDFQNLLDTLPKPLGVNSNFGVIDAYGNAAYFETGNYKYVKVDANDPKVAPHGILIRTNHSMSGDLDEGFGFNRYENASRLLEMAREENDLSPEHLLQSIPRSLYHPRTKTDLTVNIPDKRDVEDFRFFIDYIPRVSTSSTFMIVGAKDERHVEEAMMWTILGFPLVSVAVPAWLSAGELPAVAAMQDDFSAALCNAALKFKDECFPIKIDKGTNYIDLSPVLNREGTGYLQKLKPIEDEIFARAKSLIRSMDKKYSKRDILKYYNWLDDYLEKSYKDQFDVELLPQLVDFKQ